MSETKADYVRRAPHRAGHTVPPAMWGCKKHWFTLPALLRAKIWRAYKPGQEINMTPSDDYLKVAREVQAWIEARP